jgi:hypothetical protein
MFIAVFTAAHQSSLSRDINSLHSYRLVSVMPILILSSILHIHLPSRFFPSRFHIKNTYTFLPFLIILDLITLILLLVHLMTMKTHEPVYFAVFPTSSYPKRVSQLIDLEQLNRFFPFNIRD